MKCPKCHVDNPETKQFCGECGTQLPLGVARASLTKTLETTTDELTRGMIFAGRYEVIEELGTGGMGRVYRVHDTKLNEEVALKLIRPEIAAEKRVVERFRNEIKIARKITHPNVCRIHDLHEERGTLYLTMEYVRGEDLKSLIHRTKILSVGTALSIARQIAVGLAEAHKLGIVHRDLKPGNIMVDKDGNAKIMDFGIARAMREKGTTGAGAIIGTPEYMSPEQVGGEEADQRADLYALGVILFEMTMGQVPFEGKSPLSIAHGHLYELPPEPRSLNPQIPADLNRFILRCLEKPLEKRYQTTDEFLSDLDAIEKSLPTREPAAARAVSQSGPRTRREITVKFTMKRWLIGAVAIVTLGAGGYLILNKANPKSPASRPSSTELPAVGVLNFANTAKEPSLEIWRQGLPEVLTQSLSQSKYIRTVPLDRITGVMKELGLLDVQNFSTGNLQKIAKRAGAAYVATGSLINASGKIIVTLVVYNTKTSGSSPAMKVELNNVAEISTKLYVLTRQIKLDMGLSIQMINKDYDVEAREITTPYPQAFKFFFMAIDHIRNRDYAKAIKALEEAVAVDPEFAMAYRYLSAASANMGRQADSERYMSKALELASAGRLSQREKLHILARKAGLDGELNKCIELYKDLVRLDPSDWLARNMLGYSYNQQERFDLAIEQYETLVANGLDDNYFFMNYLSSCLMSNSYERAEDLISRYRSQLMEGRPNVFIIRVPLALGEYDKALLEAAAIAKPDSAYHDLRGHAFLLKNDFAAAESEYRELLKGSDQNKMDGLLALVDLLKARGRFAEALEEVQNARESLKDRASELEALKDMVFLCLEKRQTKLAFKEIDLAAIRLGVADLLPFLRALVWLGASETGRAESEAQDLKRMLDVNIGKTGNPKLIRKYEYLMGKIALAKREIGPALAHLKTAVSLLPGQNINQDHALYMESLAQAYLLSGDQTNAYKTYETITGLSLGRIGWGEINARAFYNLGEIAQQMGDEARAREKYSKFLELWKDADPGLTEVEDAMKKLVGPADLD